MEIKTDNYCVNYEPDTVTFTFQGSLRLSGVEDYQAIANMLNEVAENDPPGININLEKLEFLNSSGISMLSKFVIKVRKQQNIKLTIQGSKRITWQGKSLKNLQRLMPDLVLELT